MTHEAITSAFNELINIDAPVAKLGTGFNFTEGPIWHPVEQHLLFSDMPADKRRRWDHSGVQEVLQSTNKANGMTYDGDLNLIICEHSTSSLVRLSPEGKREVLCSHFEGRELNSPNDVIVRNDGSIYFTDPTYGRLEYFGVLRETQMGFQGVYRLPPNHRPGDEPELVSDRYMFTQPNGLCFSPCQKYIWVNDTEQANIRFFEIDDHGRLINSRVFASGISDYNLAGLPDGMKCDQEGNVWVTAPGGVWIYSFHGQLIGKVKVPEMVANLHWGGANWKTLFMTSETSLYAVETIVLPRQEPFMLAGANPPPAFPNAVAIKGSENASGDAIILDPSRTVLIIQDMQNDVVIEGGAFADSGSPQHAKEQNVIANIQRLADACRNKGVLVIHVHFICEPGHPAMKQNSPLAEGIIGANALVRGTWGGAPVSGLEPRHGDLIVEKMTMSAWESGRLENYIKGAGRDTIINTGAWTNMSIEHTARTGADKGYFVITPENACSTMNAEWHNASINFAMGNVAKVTKVDDVIGALR
jgi:gluconolactonase